LHNKEQSMHKFLSSFRHTTVLCAQWSGVIMICGCCQVITMVS